MKPNLCYAQSGGVTAVINTSAAAVIQQANQTSKIGRVYAAKNGILGVLHEELAETWRETPQNRKRLAFTPGGAFGSCRYKLPDPNLNLIPHQRLMNVFRAHNIQYLLYNGGNDSADTALKLSSSSKMLDWPLVTVGIPKTIDNDLASTDCCPGFGSAAKYVAVSVAETTLDVASMSRTSTKVFVLEVMGRHAGWLAASAGLADSFGALMIITPEVPFRRNHFVKTLQKRVKQCGFAVVVVSEGAKYDNGEFLSASESADAFAHKQLGGAAPQIASIVKDAGFKCHWSVADYLQRAARHVASKTDAEQAWALGTAAVKLALQGKNASMPVIHRTSNNPYRWKVKSAMLKNIANKERKMPASFYNPETYRITSPCKRYLSPLIAGEAPPTFGKDGLPQYARLANFLTRKKLPPWRE